MLIDIRALVLRSILVNADPMHTWLILLTHQFDDLLQMILVFGKIHVFHIDDHHRKGIFGAEIVEVGILYRL